jgi:hypothetical protein
LIGISINEKKVILKNNIELDGSGLTRYIDDFITESAQLVDERDTNYMHTSNNNYCGISKGIFIENMGGNRLRNSENTLKKEKIFDRTERPRMRNTIIVPLMNEDDRCEGLIQLANTWEGREFNEEDEFLIKLLG